MSRFILVVALLSQVANADELSNSERRVRSALECRTLLDIRDSEIKKILVQKDEFNWVFTAHKNFTVMGLPIKTAELFIDPSGENGQTYDAHYLTNIQSVTKALKRQQKHVSIKNAELSLAEKKPVPITRCTVNGEYDESGYQEPLELKRK